MRARRRRWPPAARPVRLVVASLPTEVAVPARLALVLVAALAACALPRPAPPTVPPPVPREFRGVWVATVANIDWPSVPGLPPAQQQAELLAVFDRVTALGLNAVVLQVRPAADALYRSSLEPWSEYLVGPGGADPGWDPLAFAVAEAHRRGLELHAWFNPFRARHPSARAPLDPRHIAARRPDLVRAYGRYLWLDPGEPEARAHSLRVLLDVVERYDIDGVHIDDYFYPYPETDSAGRPLPFPDSGSYARYRAGGGRLARDDWRRANIDAFVRALYREVKRRKPWVKVGISPFGIWRPGHPPGIEGFDAYARLYADSRRWWREGWLDYFAPQLYWPLAQRPQNFPALLAWWAGENVPRRHLWPGLNASRVGPEGWPVRELVAQIFVVRAFPGTGGHLLFSERALRGELGAVLDTAVYRVPAAVPASPWLRRGAPSAPRLWRDGDSLRWAPRGRVGAAWWALRWRGADGWQVVLRPGYERAWPLPADALEAWLGAIDRVGHEGPAARWRRADAARRAPVESTGRAGRARSADPHAQAQQQRQHGQQEDQAAAGAHRRPAGAEEVRGVGRAAVGAPRGQGADFAAAFEAGFERHGIGSAVADEGSGRRPGAGAGPVGRKAPDEAARGAAAGVEPGATVGAENQPGHRSGAMRFRVVARKPTAGVRQPA